MPNWLYLVINFLYLMGLAVWIGGTIVLGGMVAPALFRALPRQEAGAIFGPILGRFARLRAGAVLLVLAAAIVRYLAWESHATTPWIALRWVAIAFLAFTVTYEVTLLEPAIEGRLQDLKAGLPEDDPRRRAFASLHRRSEVLMGLSLVAAMVALLLS